MTNDTQKVILLSDLSNAQPAEALANRPCENTWYQMDYELEDGTKGIMLTADPHYRAPEIRIPLGAEGSYRIYIGVNYLFQCWKTSSYGSIWLKLPEDPGFSRIGMERYDLHAEGKYRPKIKPEKATKESYNTIYEVYWRTADLTGKDLTVCMPQPPYDNEFMRELANISFIRLEPATEEDIALETDLKPRDETKNMAVIWCAGALTGHTAGHYMHHPTESRWFDDDFEAYRNSDFGIFCFEAMRGNLCLFKTRYGDTGNWDRSWDPNWVDPLAEFTRLAKASNTKIFASLRMIGGGRPNAFNPINWGRFYWENQQWSKIDRDGNACSNVSLAYEGVRRHWLNLMRETLDYGIDGLQIHFNRCHPLVMYEEPVLESFQEKYGIDGRTIPEEDQRWQEHVAGYVTQFLREVRALLDEKPGRELSILVRGFREFEPGSIRLESDPETWIREGLADYFFLDHAVDPGYLRYWKDLSEGRLKVYASLMPRTQPGEEFAKFAESLYAAGADGFCVWDCERRIQRQSEWNVLKHLGHRERLPDFVKRAPDYYRFNKMKFMRGVNVAYSYKDG